MANTTVQDIYIAYYGRPADPDGEAYWRTQLEQADGNLDAVIDAFGTSPEFTDRFGDLGTSELINAIYQRLFNRDADASGLEFYSDLLDSNQRSLGTIALDILNGTSGEDRVLLDEKLARAADFTHVVALSNTTYAGERGIAVGSNLIATIGSAWTEFHREEGAGIAERLGQDPANFYQVSNGIVPQFLAQLRDDPHYLDIDKYSEFGIAHGNAAYLMFDERLVIDGVFVNRTINTHDYESYILVDLAPGNYDFALSGGTDPFIGLFADDRKNGLEARRIIVDDENHVQIRLRETVDLTVRVGAEQGSGEYRLTITESDETYPAHDLYQKPDNDPNPYAVFFDYLFI